MKQVLVLGTLLSLFLRVQSAQAQVLYTLESPNPCTDGCFGYSVSDAGDVNGDGYAEVIVGAMQEDLTPQSEGNAYVFEGSQGDLLMSLQFPGPGDPTFVTFGRVVSGAGDLDSDGHDDFMATAIVTWGPWGDPSVEGWAYAFSGETGQVENGFGGPPSQTAVWNGFGWSIDGAGDVNGDGHGDVIVGSPLQGRAYVWDGDTGGWMYTLVPPNQQQYGSLGRSVSGIPDVDGDGCSDLVVGADYDWEGPGGTHAGRAYVFSGADSSLLHTLVSANPESAGRFGISLSSAADINADGHEDVVVGAYMEDGGAIDAGRAYIFSGLDGVLLYTLVSAYPESAGYFGYSVSGAGDVNADGHGDVVIGAYGEDGGAPDAGRAYIFSGNGGSLLYVLESPYPESGGRFGYCVSGGGDMNGDGRSEVIVGAYQEDGGATNAGRVYVFNGIEVPVELTSFTAQALNGCVLLQWTTQTEQDNYGFHLYRATAELRDFLRISEAIIPGAGTSTIPHHYSHTDPAVEAGLTYFYKLADIDVQGNQTLHGPVSVSVTPARFALVGNHPNPFSEMTTVRFSLAAPGHVRVNIYNAAGDLVSELADGEMMAGTHETQWDGRDDAGNALPAGAYTCKLSAKGQTQSCALVLIR